MKQEVVSSDVDVDKSEEGTLSNPDKKVRDTWDYLDILARPVSAFITAIAVASLGVFANMAINANNQTALRNAEREQNTRLYTELLSNREQADSNLRKDMFTTILRQFLTEKVKTPEDKFKAVSDRMLKLELLALNFGEALTLRPLFQEMNRSIESETDIIAKKKGANSAQAFRGLLKPRLESLARRVSDKQLSALNLGGKTLFVEAPQAAFDDDGKGLYEWQYYEAENILKTPEGKRRLKKSGLTQEEWTDEEVALKNTITVDGITREYSISLMDVNPRNSEVTVELSIQTLGSPGDPGYSPKPVDMKFKLNFFNFPLIDNTRLSGNQRFALVLTRFDHKVINIVGITFPGTYASQRDKPFLNDAIEQLNKEQHLIDKKYK